MVFTDGRARTRSHSVRPISRPVASPACSTRRTLCAASRPSAGRPSAPRSNCAPHSSSSRTYVRSRFDQHRDRRLVAEAVAGAHGVGGVQRRRVVVAHRRRDAALRVAGVALGRFGLGEDQDAAGRRQTDRRAQPGDTAADDEKIWRVHAGVILPSASDGSRPHRRHHALTRLPRDDRRGRARRPRRHARRDRRTRAPIRRVEPAGVAAARTAARARGQSRRADPDPGRRALQTALDRLARLRRAGSRQRRSRLDDHHLRRRRDRRHGRFRRGVLPARHLARPCPDHAAGAGGQRDRRQGRRQSSARQEPDRRLLSAARRHHRSVGARHAAAPRVPRRAVRSRSSTA